MPYDSEHGKLWQDIKADLDKTGTRASKFAANAEWAFGKKTARVLGILALFAVAVILLFVFLNLYVAPTKPSEKKDLVLAVAQMLAGTALLSGLYFTWRTLQVNREGQITDRFTRAIDQLGATDNEGDKLFEIRIGGIYALERIARESEEEYWSIVEVLTAYVRQHARWLPEEGQGSEADSAVEDKSVEGSSSESESTEVPSLGPDIQAIITVLRRRTRFFGQGEPESLDLHETNLSGVNLSKANLSEADLSGTNLSRADLSGADLSVTDLSGADLSGANLFTANLSGANLSTANLSGTVLTAVNLLDAYLFGVNLSGADLSYAEANLSEANLSEANPSEANLPKADLSGAKLSEADLSGTDLSRANLSGANLWEVDLSYATLSGANLSEADLSGANLSGANLSKANLSEADLSGTDLSGADFGGARLPGACLAGATLTQEQLARTYTGDENTQLPPDLKAPTHWGVKTNEQVEGE